VAEKHIRTLQKRLQDDDCFLPHHRRSISPLCTSAVLEGDGQGLDYLRSGVDRQRSDCDYAWHGQTGDRITYRFSAPSQLHRIRLVMDSDFDRESLPEAEHRLNRSMFHNRHLCDEPSYVPRTLIKAYRLTAGLADGSSLVVAEVNDNHYRLRRHEVDVQQCVSLTLHILDSWGYDKVRMFAFEAE
jgi:hypothetical protein